MPTNPPPNPRRLRDWITDPQIMTLAALLLLAVLALWIFAFQLAPFLIALVLAYFLEEGIGQLTRRGMKRAVALGMVYGAYLVAYLLLLAGPVPALARRAAQMGQHLAANPESILARLQSLPDLTMGLLSEAQRQEVASYLLNLTRDWMGLLVSGSLELLPQVGSWIVYLFLVPLLVFFFLKDKDVLIQGFLRFLPKDLGLVTRIWNEMEVRMGGYVRGKIWEILIVGVVSVAVFHLLGFDHALVIGTLSGISVLVPYVGALAAAVPLFVQGVVQWGLTADLWWLMGAYAVIQFVDGNVLVPLMLSDAVKLHPVIILLSVLLFGSLWGFWGVLFAIPLATMVKVLLLAIQEFRNAPAGKEA